MDKNQKKNRRLNWHNGALPFQSGAQFFVHIVKLNIILFFANYTDNLQISKV
jgi:hypothetical protein